MASEPVPGAARAGAHRAAATQSQRGHGIRLGGLAVVLPVGEPVRYRVGVRVYPVPRAMPRLRGLMNVDGLPVPVFDVGPGDVLPLPVVASLDVLVLREGAQAIALTGCGAPAPLVLRTSAAGGDPTDPFGIAREALEDVDTGQLWYTFSLDALIDSLAALLPARPRSAGAHA
ncbi:MAG: hypothetical protein R3E87_17395 [Burkholderiaceae bacterium]